MKTVEVNRTSPLCLCGLTVDGRMVMGGAFQLADTQGVPLWFSMDQAEERNWSISIPHYFASALEHGWDDVQTFVKIREALEDRGQAKEIERIKLGCIAMFMNVARTMPGQPATEIGRRMRERLEVEGLAVTVAAAELEKNCTSFSICPESPSSEPA